MEMNSNKLYVLYFVTILHSDTSMFVYIKTDELQRIDNVLPDTKL